MSSKQDQQEKHEGEQLPDTATEPRTDKSIEEVALELSNAILPSNASQISIILSPEELSQKSSNSSRKSGKNSPVGSGTPKKRSNELENVTEEEQEPPEAKAEPISLSSEVSQKNSNISGKSGKNSPAGKSGTNSPAGKSGTNSPAGKSGRSSPAGKSGTNSPAGKSGKNSPAGKSGKNSPAGKSGKNSPVGNGTPKKRSHELENVPEEGELPEAKAEPKNKAEESSGSDKIPKIIISDLGTVIPTTSTNKAKEIFRLAEVQLYSLNADSPSAKILSSAEDLRILEVPGRLSKEAFDQNSPAPAFIQVGDWIYPLIPFNSPIYRYEEGHYIFPDLLAEKPGASTGLVLPSSTLGLEIDEFENILKTFSGVEQLHAPPPMMFGDTSTMIENAQEKSKKASEVPSETKKQAEIKSSGNPEEDSKTRLISVISNSLAEGGTGGTTDNSVKELENRPKDIIRRESKSLTNKTKNSTVTTVAKLSPVTDNCGPFFNRNVKANIPMIYHTGEELSTTIADGIMAGAEVIFRGLTFGANVTSDLIEQGTGLLKRNLHPASSPKQIHRKLHQGVKTAKNYTGKAVELSSYVVNELSNATVSLALYLTPLLRDTTTNLVSRATGNSQESSYIVDNVLEVTTGTFQGMQMVYSGIDAAAKVVAKSITNNTVDVITHCYGNQAGEIIDDAAETVGNIVLTGSNATALNPVTVASHAAKDTGKVLFTKDKTRNDFYHRSESNP